MGSIEIDGVEIYYELAGPEGAPVVALANGIFAEAPHWAPQVQALSTHYRVLTFDFLGQGQSSPATEPITPAQQAELFERVLNNLNIASVHYVGISYGGEVGLNWAIQQPKVLKSVVLADCVARIHQHLGDRVGVWIEAMRAGDSDRLFDISASDIFSESFMAANVPLMGAIKRGYAHLNFASLLNLLDNYEQYDVSSQLGQINVPTLLICGESDTLKPPAVMGEIFDAIPNAEYVVVPRAGHALHMERPGEFMTCVAGFLAKAEARPRGLK